MNFENYFNRISLNDCDYFQNPETDTRKVLEAKRSSRQSAKKVSHKN